MVSNHIISGKTLALLLWGATVLLMGCDGPGNNNTEEKDWSKELSPACHYIEGGAKNATGGSGGSIYIVSTLEDSFDPDTKLPIEGTLRYACTQGGARIILFDIAGTIHLKSPLEISKPNLTIYGQSAPGTGICLADYPLIIKADNVIVRFLHIRLGNASLKKNPEEDYDAVSVNNTRNVVLDHCSCSWSVDECVSCYGNTDFTMQYCFVTESLRDAGHVKGAHGYGGIWGGTNATFHHNLLAHHDSRNPRFDHDYVDASCKGPIDFVNNVVYNWGGNNAYGGEGRSDKGAPRQINFVANYFKPGPASNRRTQLVNPTTKCGNCGGEVLPGRFWIEGNILYGSDDVTSNNWLGVRPDDSARLERCKATERVHFTDIREESAEQAFKTVLQKAGCSLVRDAIDQRIAKEVEQGTTTYTASKSKTKGLIDLPSDCEGWITYAGETEKDSDFDGIPDAWEEAHGLNPKSYQDGKKQTLVAGFYNIEVYLNDIVKHLY